MADNGKRRRQWPASRIDRWPVSKLTKYARNARTHSKEQVEQIAASMLQFGWTNPVLADEKGVLIAGHGRVMGAELNVALGHPEFEEAPVIVARGWSEAEKNAYRIADNQLALSSDWDRKLLELELIDLKGAGFDLGLTGFSASELLELGVIDPPPGMEQLDRHALLKLVDITIKEPRHAVSHGEHYVLGGRHHLLVANVISEWRRWSPVLTEEEAKHPHKVLFCPYAGVFIPFSVKARDHVLVMVQPDPYIAGHVLDRFADVSGEKQIDRREPAAGAVKAKKQTRRREKQNDAGRRK